MSQKKDTKIRIIATKPDYRTAPFFLSPTFDTEKKVYKTGQQNLSDAELAKQKIKIDPNESYPVKHNMVLDLSVEADKVMYNFFLQKDDIIAPSKKDVNPGQHRFYFENKEDEAKSFIEQSDLEFEAETLVRKLNYTEQMDLARLLGEPIKDMSKMQVESALKKKARRVPQIIIDVLSDKDKEYKILLGKLVDAEIITKKDGGKYYNGGELIGINELYAVLFLKDKKNTDLVNQWSQMQIEKEEALQEV